MAILNISLDTQAQTISLSIDGEEVDAQTISCVNIWNYGGGKRPDFHFNVETNKSDDDVSLTTYVRANRWPADEADSHVRSFDVHGEAGAAAERAMANWGLERRGKETLS